MNSRKAITPLSFCPLRDSDRGNLCAEPRNVVGCSLLSHVWLSMTPWTVARKAPLSMGFPRQEYWSGLTFHCPGIFPTQGSHPGLLHCRQFLYHWATREAPPTPPPPEMWVCSCMFPALECFLEQTCEISTLPGTCASSGSGVSCSLQHIYADSQRFISTSRSCTSTAPGIQKKDPTLDQQ